jgi:hypothetical protein
MDDASIIEGYRNYVESLRRANLFQNLNSLDDLSRDLEQWESMELAFEPCKQAYSEIELQYDKDVEVFGPESDESEAWLRLVAIEDVIAPWLSEISQMRYRLTLGHGEGGRWMELAARAYPEHSDFISSDFDEKGYLTLGRCHQWLGRLQDWIDNPVSDNPAYVERGEEMTKAVVQLFRGRQ